MIIQRKRSNAVLNRGGQESRWGGAIFPQKLWERPVLILILEMEVD
jgi:hypothetical protein